MNILRLSTLSLALVMAVMTLGSNPSFANKPVDGKHDHGDEGNTETTFTVNIDVDSSSTMDGPACTPSAPMEQV